MGDDSDVRESRWSQYRTHIILSILAMGLVGSVLYWSWTVAGPISTVVYVVLFVLAAGLLPGLIALMGQELPFGAAIGRLQFVLGQFTAGGSWLVQLEDGWRLCPGDDDRYWLDGQYRAIDAGGKRSMLGWQPFGIVWDSSHADLSAERVDPRNTAESSDAVADGGADVQRGGVSEVRPDPSVTGDETWLIDLKALYRSGLARVGNMSLNETAEQEAMRDEVGGGVADTWAALIAGFGGLISGAVIGYVVILA